MELTNLTARDVFIPAGNKVGIVVPASGTLTVSDDLRGDSAIESAIANSLVSAGNFDTDAGSPVAQEEVNTVEVALTAASGGFLVAHSRGYRPVVQLLDAAGSVLPLVASPGDPSVVHTDADNFTVDVGVGPFTGTIVYR